MPFQTLPAPDRVRMIEARLIPPALRVSETGLEEGAAHLVVLAAGSAEILQGETRLALGPSTLVWLPPGPAGRLRLDAGSRAARLKATEIGLAHAMPTGAAAIALREGLRETLVQAVSESERREAFAHIEAIAAENFAPAPGSDTVTAALLSVLLIRLWRGALAEVAAAGPVPRSLIERFVLLVGQHKREQWTVEAYARRLGVSRERLGSAIRRATGLSPQAYIHREILTDARGLLLNSSLQVTEVAFRLGFQDPGYFNRFFTRHEGLSPGRFRRSAAGSRTAPPQSYAAWP